jgi:predicted RNase H-like HicB family nuclease
MSEKNYVLNVKNKAGTIFTVRGDTYKEFVNNINEAIEGSVEIPVGMLEGNLLSANALSTVTSTLGAVSVEQPAGFAPVPPPTVAPVAAVGGNSQRQCLHGLMTKREGSGQYGPYKAYYCPTPKGTADQCKPIYIKPNDADWATF